MNEFFIANDGIRLHAKLDLPVEKKEKYPLVIIIHGFTGHMEEPHIVAVQEAVNAIGFASLRVEMYGHGKSDGDFKDHTLLKWITNAMAVTDYAKSLDFVSDLYICGHSQGGLLTMLIAGMYPDVFRGIIPLSPAWMIPEQARRGIILGREFDPVHLPEEIAGENFRLGPGYIRAARILHPEEQIAVYHGPVLIVHGDADETVPVSYAFRAKELYENCRLVILPGDTHCYDHHLADMTDAVKRFLAKVRRI